MGDVGHGLTHFIMIGSLETDLLNAIQMEKGPAARKNAGVEDLRTIAIANFVSIMEPHL